MIFTTPETVSLVKSQRRDEFIAAMFLPDSLRELVITIYALDIELAHVHHVVKEEMMGHIRYAWWQEAVEQVAGGGADRGQPLLKAFASSGVKLDHLLPIVIAYRESYPNLPSEIEKIIEGVVLQYVSGSPKEKKWKKAAALIARHRGNYGRKYDSLLLIKLLFV